MEQTITTLAHVVAKAEAIGPDGLLRVLDILDEVSQSGAQGMEAFARDNDISRSKAYDEWASGRLETFCVGRRRLVSRRAARQWRRNLEEREAAQRAADGKAAA